LGECRRDRLLLRVHVTLRRGDPGMAGDLLQGKTVGPCAHLRQERVSQRVQAGITIQLQ